MKKYLSDMFVAALYNDRIYDIITDQSNSALQLGVILYSYNYNVEYDKPNRTYLVSTGYFKIKMSPSYIFSEIIKSNLLEK